MKNAATSGKLLVLSLGFTVFLLVFRILYTGSLHYIFLTWNLFLAAVPFFISRWLWRNSDPLIQGGLFFIWLIFFPNAPYIITDFLHLGESPRIPKWFDVMLLFSASWNGLLLGLLSLFGVEEFLLKKFNRRTVPFVLIFSLFLGGFGVYAGRYLRWNSWQIFTSPSGILKDTAVRVLRPMDHLSAWGLTFFMGMFLVILFYTIRSMAAREIWVKTS